MRQSDERPSCSTRQTAERRKAETVKGRGFFGKASLIRLIQQCTLGTMNIGGQCSILAPLERSLLNLVVSL